MKSIEIEGKRSVEEAVSEGLKELGVKKDDVIIEVLQESGLFARAKVRLTIKETKGDLAKSFVDGLLERMGIESSSEVLEDEEEIKLNLSGSNAGAIIGYRGEVLDSIQYIASVICNHGGKEDYKRVRLNTEGYRERREEALENLADRMADKAVAMGRRVSLDPMNPYERRIIHMRLSENPEVTAHSEGEEPNRRLIIVPKCEKRFDRKGGRGHSDKRSNNRGGKKPYNNRQEGRSQDYKPSQFSDGYSGFNNESYNAFSDNYRFGSGSSGFSETDLSSSGKNYTSSKKYNK